MSLIASIIEYGFIAALHNPASRPYLCTGAVVGYGGDGEPVIADVKKVAGISDEFLATATIERREELRLTAEINVYRERLARITDKIATQLYTADIERNQRRVDALQAGRRWYGDVEYVK